MQDYTDIFIILHVYTAVNTLKSSLSCANYYC